MTGERKRILVVEDDPSLASWIADYLTDHAFEVTVASHGEAAIDLIRSEGPDLVVLDLMLPRKNGFSVCREVRAFFTNPILIITAGTEEADEVLGLELGADDYLCKPLKPRVLLARINVLLRRGAGAEHPGTRTFGALCLDAAAKTVFCGSTEIAVSVNEFDVLWLLASRAGEVVSRGELVANLRGFDYDGFDRSMDIRISRLRRKLEGHPQHGATIKTVRGKGYLFAAQAR